MFTDDLGMLALVTLTVIGTGGLLLAGLWAWGVISRRFEADRDGEEGMAEWRWQSIGTPPACLNEALSFIRQELLFTYGDKVVNVPWCGFIEWAITEESKIEEAGVIPIFRVRYAEKIEDTKLAAFLNEWMAGRLKVPVNHDFPEVMRQILRVNLGRMVQP